MLPPHVYELIDFGRGRKLERFGGQLVDRPCPAAEREACELDDWTSDLRFSRTTGKWTPSEPDVPAWQMEVLPQLQFQLAPTPAGQVGVFPEQYRNWQWIADRLAHRRQAKVLNLFAYTGGSTLAAAAQGAEVVHLDASKRAVAWARENATLSGLGDAPIRWIVDDAQKFVKRERKRGQRYDGIILDPPSYGHGTKGEEWKLSRDLVDLLSNCRELLTERPAFVLVSCHTPGFGESELSAALTTCLFGSCAAGVQSRELLLTTSSGRPLPAGVAAYWP